MPDLEILCPACEQTFSFTEDEQAQCAENAFPQPTYCPACHSSRKAAREEKRDSQRRGSKRRRR